MAIQIEKYQPHAAVPTGRTPMPDPSAASLLAREAATGASNASTMMLNAYQNNAHLQAQQAHLDVQLAKHRYESNLAYQADDARMQFDTEAYEFLQDAQETYKNKPNELLRATQDFLTQKATQLATTGYDPQTQSSFPRFQDDPDATHTVRGDLLQRGQTFLGKANELVTKLTIDNHLNGLEKSAQIGMDAARNAGSPVEAAAAIKDVTTSYTNAAGNVLAPDKAYAAVRDFQDKAWNAYYEQQATLNPDAFIQRLAVGKPAMQTKEGDKNLGDLAYRTFAANPDKVSEPTLRNSLQVGVITAEQYKGLLKAKGFDDDAVKDRMYAVRLNEIEAGQVPIWDLPNALDKWAAEDGLDRPRINELRQALISKAERVTKQKDDEEKAAEKLAKANGEKVEAKVQELLLDNKIKSVDEIRPLLTQAMEAKSMTAERKGQLEQMVANTIAAGGQGDDYKRNRWELDIRRNAQAHSTDSIYLDKTLNMRQRSELLALQEAETKKDRMPAHQKQVYDQERRNVGILYGDKGPMATYTNDESRTLVAGYQRYDDLVFKYKLNPRDAFYKLNEELTPLNPKQNPQFRGITLPPPAQVQQWADMVHKKQPLPQGMTPELIQSYVEQYRQIKKQQDIEAARQPVKPVNPKGK